MNVNFTPQAIADLEAIHRYIAEQNASAADRVLSRIRQVTDMFEQFPLLGRVGPLPGTRRFAIPGLPYSIIYQIANETDLDILTIIHDRQHFPPE